MAGEGKKVVVAMSGGVDSSVAAAMLVEQGFDVVGVTLDVWPHQVGLPERDDACCALSAVEDARRVADKLGIPHYTLNMREAFERTVIADFAREYLRGRTPNPCIRCNEHVKFAALLDRVHGLGARYVATGHYARVSYDVQRRRHLLRRGRDRRKDQSYVLYVMTQELLARCLMPLGDLTKDDTRRIAQRFGLATAAKAESQEICFVADNDHARFIREYTGEPARPGPILDQAGNKLGEHSGVSSYTVGQRRGLGLAGPNLRYVTAIDAAQNVVVVGEIADLYHDWLVAENVNWISVPELREPMRVDARIRYRAQDGRASLFPRPDGSVTVRFDQPQRAIAEGQAAVFYDGDLVVGGGTIASVGS